MPKADQAIGRTIESFRKFVFELPKTREEWVWKRANLLLFAGVGTIVVCTVILGVLMGRR